VRPKRLLFIVTSIVLGVGVALAASALVLARRHPPKLSKADRLRQEAELVRRLKGLYVYDDATSYRLKPLFHGFRWGTYDIHETNSRGLLGSAEIDPSRDVQKAVFLGDSVTYGDAVALDKVFVTLMQGMAGPGWQLLNAGTPGWSTHQELRYFDRYLWDVNWRAVVIVFCLNDLVKFEWDWGGEGELHMTDEIAQLDGLRGLTARTAKGLELMSLRNSFRSQPATAALADLNSATLRAWSPADWKTYADGTLVPWLQTRGSVPVMIVIAPVRDQVKALALGAPRERVLFPQRQMQAICAQNRITCVDPIDALRVAGTADEADQLFRDDLHLSEAGHRALAAIMWPQLQAFVRRVS